MGDVSLVLDSGFDLVLRDVLYVPSLSRNLISISRMDTDGYACHFGNGKCEIYLNNNCVGVAFLHYELYLLSLSDKVYSICDKNVN